MLPSRESVRSLAAASLLSAAGAATAGGVFTPLGHLPGGDFSQVTSVSDDGRFIGGHATPGGGGGFVPIIWDDEFRIALTVPAGFDGAYLNDLSGNGQAAVAISPGPAGFQGIRWDSPTTPTVLPTDPMTFSSFNAINFDGSAAVGFVNQNFFAGGSDAVLWTQSGGLQNLGRLTPGGEASLTAISNDGARAAGFASDENGLRRAVTWNNADGFQVLDSVTGATGAGMAIGISVDGQVVTGSVVVDGLDRPAFWDGAGEPTLIGLHTGYTVGDAIAATTNGVVIGNWREDAFSDELRSLAFIWDEANGVRALQDMLTTDYGVDLMGWTLNTVTDITPDGRVIVGTGVNELGQLEGYRIVIPAPGTLAPLVAGGVVFMRRRR